MPSRASSKSSLSPSVSSRSSAIDLGKNSGVDLGSKTQTSVTTAGIGITQEVGNIGGVTVTGGVSVDISPIGLSISGRSDYEDPSRSTISIAGGAEIPGGILGVSGGVTVNTSTGQIEGGSIGGEIVGIGVGISKSSEGVGVEISLQIPFTPIEISLGFEFPEGDAKQPRQPGGSTAPTTPNIGFPVEEIIPLLDDNKCYHVVFLWHSNPIAEITWSVDLNVFGRASMENEPHGQGVWTNRAGLWNSIYKPLSRLMRSPAYIEFHEPPNVPMWRQQSQPQEFRKYKANFKAWAWFNSGMQMVIPFGYIYYQHVLQPWHHTATGAWIKNHIQIGKPLGEIWDISAYEIPCSGQADAPPKRITPSAPTFPPFPNPPPRKRNMDQCCRESTAMLRELMKVLQVREVLGGKMEIPGELLQIPIEDKPLLPEKLKTYPQMINALLMAIDRHGIDAPITVEMEDSDKTKAGNQEVSYTYNSPGVALQAALELLHEIKADANARLSIQIGLAFAVTRILKIVAGSGETLRQIILMLGLPFRYKPKKLQLEFNLSGTKQGFGENTKEKDVGDLSKEELEQIIPTLLSGSEIDVPVPTFNPEDDDLREMLAKISIVQSSKKG